LEVGFKFAVQNFSHHHPQMIIDAQNRENPCKSSWSVRNIFKTQTADICYQLVIPDKDSQKKNNNTQTYLHSKIPKGFFL